MSSTSSSNTPEHPIDTQSFPQGNPLLRPFWSLRHGNYAIYWFAMAGQFWAMNMQMFVRSWYAYDLEGRASLIGAVAVAQGLPVLFFSLFGGALADRLNKRNVIIVGFTVATLSTLGVAVLITTGDIKWWHLIISAMGSGLGMALAMGARQSIILELVAREELLNAVALFNLGNNVARIAAPAVAGLLLGMALGIQGVYYVMTVLSVTSVVVLFVLPSGSFQPAVRDERQSMVRNIGEGLHYIKDHRVIIWLILVFTLSATFGMPYLHLMPVLAKEAWGVEASKVGLLFSMAGVGAVIGSLGMATLGNFRGKGVLLLAITAAFGAGIVALALSPIYLVALFVLVPLGIFQSARISLNSALAQLQAHAKIRGRVMGVYHMETGVHPFGILGISLLADKIGPEYALAISGCIVVLVCGYIYLASPEMRSLR